jgi:hypothetical protein
MVSMSPEKGMDPPRNDATITSQPGGWRAILMER